MHRARLNNRKLLAFVLFQIFQLIDSEGLQRNGEPAYTGYHYSGLPSYIKYLAARLKVPPATDSLATIAEGVLPPPLEPYARPAELASLENKLDSSENGRSRRSGLTDDYEIADDPASESSAVATTMADVSTVHVLSITTPTGGWQDTNITAGTFSEHVSEATWVTKAQEARGELRRLAQANLSDEGISSLLTDTISVINEQNSTFGTVAADIEYSSDILSRIIDFIDLHPPTEANLSQVVQAVHVIINRIMDAPRESILASDRATRITQSLERLLNLTASTIKPNETRELALENLAIQVTSDPEVIGFQLQLDHSSSGTLTQQIRMGPNKTSDQVIARISLSPDLHMARKSFVIYTNDKLFQGKNTKSIGHAIVSVQLEEAVNKPDLVTMLFQMPEQTSRGNNSTYLECGFWDFAENEWSTYGCINNGATNDSVLCSCNHTTNFAALMRVSHAIPNDTLVHHQILDYITIVGLSVSMVLLLVVIISFLTFRKLRNTVSQQVLFNLSLSILLLDATFLGGIDRTENEIGCIAAAMLLHVFLLASFAWMTTEAVLQYLRFVKVLGTYIPKFTLKAILVSWGAPVLIVGCLAALSEGNFYNTIERGLCWVHKDVLYYGVLLPIALSMSINIVVFTLIMRSLMCTRHRVRSNKAESEMMRLHLRAAVSIFITTGLTWTFGFFAIEERSSLVFQYLFCVFNAIQGALVAILHSLREKSLQNEWRKLLWTRSQKQSMSDSTNVKANLTSTTSRGLENVSAA